MYLVVPPSGAGCFGRLAEALRSVLLDTSHFMCFDVKLFPCRKTSSGFSYGGERRPWLKVSVWGEVVGLVWSVNLLKIAEHFARYTCCYGEKTSSLDRKDRRNLDGL